MAYEGMACLKIYRNYTCTDEIESNEEGTFVYNSDPISNNALKPVTHTLYVRNVGTHNAYDVVSKVITSDVEMNTSLVLTGTTIVPKQIVKLVLTGEFEMGTIGSTAVINLDYNNV